MLLLRWECNLHDKSSTLSADALQLSVVSAPGHLVQCGLENLLPVCRWRWGSVGLAGRGGVMQAGRGWERKVGLYWSGRERGGDAGWAWLSEAVGGVP